MQPRERFDQALGTVNSEVLSMADLVEQQMTLALAAYERLDPTMAEPIIELDREVNALRFTIEDQCIQLIATQQPTARDLRLIIAAMNMIVDLERMGDQTKGIAKALDRLHGRPTEKPPIEIQEMGRVVLAMLRETKHAYKERNVQLAREIAQQDDEVDRLYAKAFTQVVFRMAGMDSPGEIENEYEVLRIAREVERFGDLVTNIAERLVYLVTGSMDEFNVDRNSET